MKSIKSSGFVSDIWGNGEYAIKSTGTCTCGQDRALTPPAPPPLIYLIFFLISSPEQMAK